jgi:uncharacterized protein
MKTVKNVCTEHVGRVEDRVGVFWPEPEMIPAKIAKWHNRAIQNLATCRSCRYALLCGGGCAYLAEVLLGDMYKGHCEMFADQFELIVQDYFDNVRDRPVAEAGVSLCD